VFEILDIESGFLFAEEGGDVILGRGFLCDAWGKERVRNSFFAEGLRKAVGVKASGDKDGDPITWIWP